ncbi:hypothetical protein GWI33_016538 [Rhynchophorus ferrugineus]|uniref:Uncharacterized protein n=1 Tax=Rhynchophorus ferrugineus TaxID=354439 RepID=A0A834HXV0_RHYFE|nr:hypothetical protein GWI33_016538 [Rhynchophorus ferrugineus]
MLPHTNRDQFITTSLLPPFRYRVPWIIHVSHYKADRIALSVGEIHHTPGPTEKLWMVERVRASESDLSDLAAFGAFVATPKPNRAKWILKRQRKMGSRCGDAIAATEKVERGAIAVCGPG